MKIWEKIFLTVINETTSSCEEIIRVGYRHPLFDRILGAPVYRGIREGGVW